MANVNDRTQNINGTEVSYYELSVDKFQQQIYPNLGKANLAGYNGRQAVNGPTFRSKRGTEAVVRLINNNDLSSSMHFHGAWSMDSLIYFSGLLVNCLSSVALGRMGKQHDTTRTIQRLLLDDDKQCKNNVVPCTSY